MGRALDSGYVTFLDLKSGKVSVRDFFEVLRILDWNRYAEARARALSRAEE